MTVNRTTIRFYGDLADLVWDTDRSGEAQVPVEAPRSVKDAIESCGVPHTEVDLILVAGESVGFDHRLCGGERVSVYPPFTSLDVPSRVRPAALHDPRFVVDVHLGRLAERLRLLGFDVLYRNDFDDDDLAALSGDRRWLLTRDRGLLMRAVVTHGYLVRSTDPGRQTIEVLRRLQLFDAIEPFTRCPRCNGELEPVAKADIEHHLEPGTRATFERFARCAGCGQLYWEGSHHDALRSFVADVRDAADDDQAGTP
jgi:uncharacterized protein